MRTAAWTPPLEFEEYRLLRLLGRGAMGQVYLAHDNLLDRPVAIKFITQYGDAAARARFLTEARAAARLQHPNVVTIYRVGEIGDKPFIVSEFLRGRSMDQVAKPVPWERALELGLGLVRGLAAAHRAGVLHRDVKPANSILTDDGEVVLVDFGLAKLADPSESISRARAELPPVALMPGSEPVPATEDLALTGGLGSAETLSPEVDATTRGGTGLEETSLDDIGGSATRADSPTGGQTEAIDSAPFGSPPTGSSVTGDGAVMGTPYYMAPEAWRAEAATRATDVYAVGVVLYELCTGRPPYRELPVPELARAACEQDAPPIAGRVEAIDDGFAAIIDRCLVRDPAGRFASAEELRDALERCSAPRRDLPLPEGNPYRGLLPFEAEHRGVFFGRESESAAVVERLRSLGLVVVAGDSGVGKSSLVRAGVAPLIQRGAIDQGRVWDLISLVPGRQPTSALAVALAAHLGVGESELADELDTDQGALARRLRLHAGRDRGTLLLVDQLEDLVTLADPDQASSVGWALARMVDPGPGLRVVVTVRADYLARVAALPGVGEDIGRHLYLVRPLTAEGVRAAIEGPARAKGVRFESETLVNELASATTGAGELPLLSFALAELWNARDRDANVITATALDAIGGVAGALARHADEALAAMLPDERRAARHVLMRLVTLEGTRARRIASELGAGDPAAERAIDSLVRARLLVARESEHETSYEVAHEALLSGWATLRGWLDDEAGSRAARERIAHSATEWQRLDRSRDVLWSAAQLEEVAGIDPGSFGPAERAFLGASRRALRWRRWLLRGAVLGAALFVAAVYGVVRYQAERELDRKVATHVAGGDAALAEAHAAAASLDEQRQQAFEAFDRGDVARGEQLWAEVSPAEQVMQRAYVRASQAYETALRLASRSAIRDQLAEILFERAVLAERNGERAARDELLQRLGVYDEGDRQRRWIAPAQVVVRSDVAGTSLRLDRYLDAQDGTLARVTLQTWQSVPDAPLALEPGSYVLVATAGGRAQVAHPLRVARGESVQVELQLPPAEQVPEGFVYLPPGRFRFGSPPQAEGMRAFFATVPVHDRQIGGFMMARHETTYRDWIAFLESLTPTERAARRPKAGGFHNAVELAKVDDGRWQLTLESTEVSHRARVGEPIVYPGRAVRRSQDWDEFPVGGVSWQDALAYVHWLGASGKVPRARMCREDEWERAARGADDRLFPHGDHLAPQDANFDETYKRQPQDFGPDAVGSFPASDSPFGIADMVGNLFEMTSSVLEP
ncbi:MAG TPA: SUMF1/EgtB/PvdO family nonheme iron enzyme, partial [Kofleriaceae bacterium]|nr:SUMF1/EgtB/PvdO family nonheme iron enzyme [Kofleriaceae bacterium]